MQQKAELWTPFRIRIPNLIQFWRRFWIHAKIQTFHGNNEIIVNLTDIYRKEAQYTRIDDARSEDSFQNWTIYDCYFSIPDKMALISFFTKYSLLCKAFFKLKRQKNDFWPLVSMDVLYRIYRSSVCSAVCAYHSLEKLSAIDFQCVLNIHNAGSRRNA